MASMLQLDPPIPVVTLKGKGLARILLDHGPDQELMWVVFQDITGECWTWRSTDVRSQESFSFDKPSPKLRPDLLDGAY